MEQSHSSGRRSADTPADLDRAKVSAKTAIGAIVVVAGMVGAFYIGQQETEGRANAKVSDVQQLIGAVAGRVTVLETQRAEDKERLQRIEQKIDRVLEMREPYGRER